MCSSPHGLRQPTETENCRVNAGMVRNLLHAVEGQKIKHVALVTGAKHYMGPFEAYAKTKVVERRSAKSSLACPTRTSITSRKTRCLPPRAGKASAGRFTAPIP